MVTLMGMKSNILWLFLALMKHPSLLLKILRVNKNIIAWYFLPQFIPGRVKRVVHLDMELDKIVPFDKSYFSCYLEFTPLWMGTLGWLYRNSGKLALSEMLLYLEGLESLFGSARKVFDACGSTIRRPGPAWNVHSLLVHLCDRNLFCLPSLHVMIVCFNFGRMTGIISRIFPVETQHGEFLKMLENKALRIVEAIIKVKQHSLIDISAALFLSTATGTGLGRENDLKFLQSLFLELQEDGPRLRAFLTSGYNRFSDAWNESGDPIIILLDFLYGYPQEIQLLLAAIQNPQPNGAGCWTTAISEIVVP